ncbi:MAG: DinB family protein [Cyclobacteriaceae bacterium]|nr:DinB family protein [Cyclobacteriaceae bacterium]
MNRLISTILFLGIWMINSSFVPPSEELSKDDRKAIISYLKKTRSALINKVKSLSPAQWSYKPAPEVWSPAEISEHILKAEAVVLKRVTNLEGKEYKPALTADYKEKGEEMIAFIVGREKKFQAPEPVAPTGTFGSPEEFIKAFEQRRDETIDLVKTIDQPIKAYYEVFGPIGEVNGYHWLLFISAHTERHMVQLDSVVADPGFPI